MGKAPGPGRGPTGGRLSTEEGAAGTLDWTPSLRGIIILAKEAALTVHDQALLP